MNSKRATDILNSTANIIVTHNGTAVWIENVEGNFAEIHYRESRKKLRVPVSELQEDESAF